VYTGIATARLKYAKNLDAVPARNGQAASKQVMKFVLISAAVLLSLTACTPEKKSPDAIRQETANATKEVTQDAKAVAQGVVDGIKDKGPVNVNKATTGELKKLPGIDDASAQKIIDNRPYDDSYDLVKKGAVSKNEYDQLAGKVTTR
jgi:DNA uptake protein ComE-like DNA-binding protein